MFKNVILITVDALRQDVCAGYGGETCHTPFLESLLGQCVRFQDAVAAGPYTQASFPGILTSSFFLEYGKLKELPRQKILISEHLKKNGVVTAGFHSNAYLSHFFGYNRGWDKFFDSMTEDVTDMYPFVRGGGINSRVKEWLEKSRDERHDKSLFLWVHYMDVHEPYVAEKKHFQDIDPDLDMSKDEMFSIFKNVVHPRKTDDAGEIEVARKLYDSKVREVDGYVEELYSILNENNLIEDSLIIFTSDHGDEFGEHGGLSHDGKMYRELLNVPLYLLAPGMSPSVYGPTVSGADVPPTIAVALGLPVPPSYQGSSLIPLEDYRSSGGYSEAVDKEGHKEKDTDQPVFSLTVDDMKVILRTRDNSWELYDHTEDPWEQHNIADTSVEAGNMRARLLSAIKEHKA